MTPKSENIINELNRIYELFKRPLVIVETGTIRNTSPDYETGDGHSTKDIAKWCSELCSIADAECLPDPYPDSQHSFYSIDTDCSIAQIYLSELNLREYVKFREALSTDILPLFKEIDFAYLDSANDPDNCLNEFLIVWPKITKSGSVMVDDCNEASTELLKGDKLMPYLRENNIPFETLPTNQIIIRK